MVRYARFANGGRTGGMVLVTVSTVHPRTWGSVEQGRRIGDADLAFQVICLTCLRQGTGSRCGPLQPR